VPTCPVTGEPLGRANTHIDHGPPWPFDALVREFARQFQSLDGLVAPTADGETITRFAEPAMAGRFRSFHDQRANMQAVSRHANLSEFKKSRLLDGHSLAAGVEAL